MFQWNSSGKNEPRSAFWFKSFWKQKIFEIKLNSSNSSKTDQREWQLIAELEHRRPKWLKIEISQWIVGRLFNDFHQIVVCKKKSKNVSFWTREKFQGRITLIHDGLKSHRVTERSFMDPQIRRAKSHCSSKFSYLQNDFSSVVFWLRLKTTSNIRPSDQNYQSETRLTRNR